MPLIPVKFVAIPLVMVFKFTAELTEILSVFISTASMAFVFVVIELFMVFKFTAELTEMCPTFVASPLG